MSQHGSSTGVWQVRLAGDGENLDRMRSALRQPDCEISSDDIGLFLRSKTFAGLHDAGKVRERAGMLVRRIRGAWTVLHAMGAIDLRAGGAEYIEPEGRRHVFIEMGGSITAAGSCTLSVGDPSSRRAEIGAADYITLGESDANVAKLLEYSSEGLQTWEDLYKAFEIVRDDLGSEAEMVRRGYDSKGELERFRRSSNSPAASGRGARHAVETTRPPANPMPLDDARVWIRGLVKSWLLDKSTSSR